jgi:hypothetical protein
MNPQTGAFSILSSICSYRSLDLDPLGVSSLATTLERFIPPSVLDTLNELPLESLCACDVTSRVSRKRENRYKRNGEYKHHIRNLSNFFRFPISSIV